MPFVKLVKNRSYFSRYQVKFRRRREGKTDYYARKRLITQDKNKYNSPKYRLVVRFTNTEVICQIVYAKIDGDYVLGQAKSTELTRYGLAAGLKNYAASYCTGLLLARRVLQSLGLADTYKGQVNVNGEDYNVEAGDDGPRPFRAYLDVGLTRTTTGNRVFAAMKGVVDGGIEVPHGVQRFVGFDKEKKELDAKKLRSALFGGPVAGYMRQLSKDDEDRYKLQFAGYIKAGVTADKLEAVYKGVHKKIREDPAFKKKTPKERGDQKQKRWNASKLSLQQRKDRVRQKKESFLKQQGQEGEN